MRLMRRDVIMGLAGLGFLGFSAGAAMADDDEDDHIAAARARASGEIRPLIEILEHVKIAHPGEVVGIELERKKGRWIYEIKLIAPDGRFFKIYVDARDKSTIKIKGK